MPGHKRDRMVDDRDARFRSLFEQSIDAIYIVAPDGRSLEANQAWLDMFGYSREELFTLRAEAVYAHPANRAGFLHRISQTGFVKDEERFRSKDGTEFDCERTVAAIVDDSGTLVAYQGVYRNITERKRAEEALRTGESRYRSLFENSMDAIYIGSPEGAVIDVNQAWLDLFGYTREELATLNAADVYVDPHGREDFLSRIAESGHVEDEVSF